MKRLLVSLVVVAALAAPATALANGVVLKVQRANHLVAVTRPGLKVSLVHTSAASRLHVGQRVALTARTLRNGTLASSAARARSASAACCSRSRARASSSPRVVR